jgi:hypothetical protein
VIKVGDRVTINKPTIHPELTGKTGTVKRIDEGMNLNEGTALVKFDAGHTISCRLNELTEVKETGPRKQD